MRLLLLNPIYIEKSEGFNVWLEEWLDIKFPMLEVEKIPYPHNRIRYKITSKDGEDLGAIETMPIGGTLRFLGAYGEDVNNLPSVLDDTGTMPINFFASILSFLKGAFMVPEIEVNNSLKGSNNRPWGLPPIKENEAVEINNSKDKGGRDPLPESYSDLYDRAEKLKSEKKHLTWRTALNELDSSFDFDKHFDSLRNKVRRERAKIRL